MDGFVVDCLAKESTYVGDEDGAEQPEREAQVAHWEGQKIQGQLDC